MYYAYNEEEKISVEPTCYKKEHINQVLAEIKANFAKYFRKFIETEAGNSLEGDSLAKLSEKFNVKRANKEKNVDPKTNLIRIIDESIKDFKNDRHSYLEFLDKEYLSEYETDPADFKNTVLRNQCPIIRYTLQNKRAKELDKYRYAFKISDPMDLLEVVSNITNYATNYEQNVFPSKNFTVVDDVEELEFSELEQEKYFVFGVIGGGIKSHFLYKLYPHIFPNRSRDAIWSLWYLTDKKTFDCKQNSEFLMIELEENVTQQNYFYPYDLFGFYAAQILKLLNQEAKKIEVSIPDKYRFVIVDTFFSFIAKSHKDEIDDLKRRVKNDRNY